MSRSLESARKYCLDTLQRYDYPSYLLYGRCPGRGRDAFLALRAFNVDLALVPDQVSQAVVGRMRYQFWTETVDKCFRGTPPAQPVALLLHHVLDTCPPNNTLTKPYLLRMIAERETRIDDMSFPTIDKAERYAERTSSTLLYLQLESLGIRLPAVDDCAQHVGLATGLVSLVRGFGYYLERRQVVIPADLCAHAGVRQEDLLRAVGATHNTATPESLKSPPAPLAARIDPQLRSRLQDATFAMATRANDHLISAAVRIRDDLGGKGGSQREEKLAKVADDAKSVLLARIPAKLFLERLEKHDFDPTAPALLKREWKLPWRLWRGE
ncbi:hypothetical protein PYCC9005_004800 [Savitreella phatthalungensis]